MYKAPPPMQNRGGLTTYFSTQKGDRESVSKR